MNIEKTYLADEKSFRQHQAKYWSNSSYVSYTIREPMEYPCVALEISEPDGDLGTHITITDFVYQTDFRID